MVVGVTVPDPAYTAATGFDSLWMFSWESRAVVRLPLPGPGDGMRSPADDAITHRCSAHSIKTATGREQ